MAARTLLAICVAASFAAAGFALSQSLINNTKIAKRSSHCSEFLVSEVDVHRHVLTGSYSKTARPIRNGTMPLPVTLGFVLERIEDIIEKFRTITLSGYLIVNWRDEFLVWEDVEPLNCIDTVVFSADEVWFPDVAIINSGDKYSIPLARGHKVQVDSDGQSSYFPSGIFSTACELNLRYFPFDRQICVLRVGSWCYWKEMQPIILTDPPIDHSNMSINEQWTLVRAEGTAYDIIYPLDPRTWQKIEWRLHLQRKSAYYIINVIVPSCIISIVEVVTFALPLQKVMKVHISFTALLAYSVFQLMIIGDIPRASEHTPLLTIYIDLSMAYIGFVLLGEGVVFVCLDRARHKKISPPRWAFRILGIIGRCYGYHADEIYDEIGFPDHRDVADDRTRVQSLPPKCNAVAPEACQPAYFSLTGRYFDATGQHEVNNSNKTLVSNGSVPTYWTEKTFAPDYYGYTSSGVEYRTGRMAAETLERAHIEKAKQATSEDVNVKSWEMMAAIFEKCVLTVYIVAIIITPITIFLILPAANPIDA